MVFLLVGLALLASLMGAALLTQATAGVGLIAVGCLFGILARVAQAAEHYHGPVMAPLRPSGAASPPADLTWLGYTVIGIVGVLVCIGIFLQVVSVVF